MLVLALSASASAGWMDNGRDGNMPNEKAETCPAKERVLLIL